MHPFFRFRSRFGLALAGIIFPQVAPAIDQTWLDANVDNNWNTTVGNWSPAGLSGGWDQSNTAIFGGTGEPVTLTAAISANSLTFGSTGYTIAGNTLTLNGATPTVSVTNAVDTATIASSLAGGSFTKTGDGTLLLTGNNSAMNNSVSVSAGLLAVDGSQVNNRLGNNAAVNIASGATFEIRGVNAVPTALNSVDITVANGGTFRTITGASAAAGGSHAHVRNLTLNGGTISLAYSGTGNAYNGESFQLNGNVSVGGSSISTIQYGTDGNAGNSGVALIGARTFTVADSVVGAGVDLDVLAELENSDNNTGALIKAGAGTMNLGSANSYTAATTVDGGILRASANGSLTGTSAVTVNNGATLETNGTNIFVGTHGNALANSKVVTLNASNWIMTASHDARIGNVVLNDGSTWTSNRTLGAFDALLGNIAIGAENSAATVSVTGTGVSSMVGTATTGLHLQGVQSFDVANTSGDAGADLLVSMTLADAGQTGGALGGINKTGAGTVALNTRATYTGGTTVTAGVLDLTVIGGGDGIIRGTATVLQDGILRLSANDVTGFNATAASLRTINLTGGELNVNTPVANQTLGGATINMTGGRITGVTGSNLDFFVGSAVNTLASSTTSTIGGTFISLRQAGGLAVTTELGTTASGIDLDVSSVIRTSLEGPLTKAGIGTMRVTAANIYTGGTEVTAGKLFVNNTTGSGTGTGNVSVAAGATLGGTGIIAGNVNVSGVLAPGASIETLQVNAANFLSGSTLSIELDSSAALGMKADLLVASSLSLADVNLSLVDIASSAGAFDLGTVFTLVNYGSTGVTDGFSFGGNALADDSSFTAGLNTWMIDYNATSGGSNFSGEQTFGNFVNITAIPEPTTALLVGLGALALLRRRRI